MPSSGASCDCDPDRRRRQGQSRPGLRAGARISTPRSSCFARRLAAEPYNVTAAYNLATALTRSGAQEEGRAAMAQFQSLRDSTYGTTYAQTYLAQGRYAEAVASTGAESDLVNRAMPSVTFVDATATMLPVEAAAGPPRSLRLRALEASRCSMPTVTAISTSSRPTRPVSASFETLGGVLERSVRPRFQRRLVASIAAVAADYDNDGRPDLFVLRAGGNRLLRQQADGAVRRRHGEQRACPAYPYVAKSAAFVDVDHDGDLDLFIVGFAAGPGPNPQTAANQLLRNNGNGTFTDITGAAGVSGGAGRGIAVVPTDFDNRRDIDLVVVARGVAPMLFQNMRDGSFRDAAADARLPSAADYTSVAAADVNKDGYTDFFLGRSDGPGVLAMSDGSGRFASSPAPAAHLRGGGRAVRRLRQRRSARSAGPDTAGVASVPQCRQRVGGDDTQRTVSRLPATPFQSMAARRPRRRRRHRRCRRRSPEASCASGGTTAAAGIVLCEFGWRGASATAAASARRSSCEPEACVRRLESSAATPSVAPADLRVRTRHTSHGGRGSRAVALWHAAGGDWTSDLPPVPQVRRSASSP